MRSFVLMLFLFGVISSQVSAQRQILNESLENVLGSGVEGSITSSSELSEGLRNWTFVNCLTENLNNRNRLRVAANGSVTTAPLTNATGNVLASFFIYPTVSDQVISVSHDGKGELVDESRSYSTKNAWNRGLPILIKNADGQTRFTLSSTSAFYIANVVVTDIDDGVYYESFDRHNGKGGNDGDYDETGDADVQKSWFDYPFTDDLNSRFAFSSWASQCVYLGSGGFYRTLAFSSSETGDYMLTFKVAGKDKNASKLEIVFKPTTSISTQRDAVTESIEYHSWVTVNQLLPNLQDNTPLRFSGEYVYLDEVLISEIKNMDLEETADNSAVLTSKNGKTVYANLTRTLKADIWNTCCLPFAITAELLREVSGNNELEVELKTLTSIENGVFSFSTATSVPAGKPFFVKVNQDIVNPVFPNVAITAPTPLYEEKDGYGFQGIYSRTTLNTDGTHVFLGTDGQLHKPSSAGNQMNGMRAYMVIPENADARVVFVDEEGETTKVDMRSIADAPSAAPFCFTLQGQRVTSPRKGIYVKDGKKLFAK